MSLRAVKDLRDDVLQLVTQIMTVCTASQDVHLLLGCVWWRARSCPVSIPFLGGSGCDKVFLKFASLSLCSLVLVWSGGTCSCYIILKTDKTLEIDKDFTPTFATTSWVNFRQVVISFLKYCFLIGEIRKVASTLQRLLYNRRSLILWPI